MVTADHTPKKLGELLLERGLLTQEQLDRALQVHRNTPKSLGRALIDAGYIRERDLVRALAEQVGLDFVDLSEHHLDPFVVTLLPNRLAHRYRAIPFGESDGKLLVAMSDPANVYALDAIRAITSREVQPVVATVSDVEQAIDKFAETSWGELEAVSGEAEGSMPSGERSNLPEPTAVPHTRAVHVVPESQARASFPLDASIERMLTATWVLVVATVSLVFATIVLIVITART
jgi:type IV pilus assembly protein PilB